MRNEGTAQPWCVRGCARDLRPRGRTGQQRVAQGPTAIAGAWRAAPAASPRKLQVSQEARASRPGQVFGLVDVRRERLA